MIVRWSFAELPETLREVGVTRPFLIASARWAELELPPHVAHLSEVPSATVDVPDDADGILAVGGGSAIDTGKFASAQSGKPVVHVPTTYSGAEWTTFYGVRSPDRIMRGGGGGAQPVAIVYDVDLTLDLPADVTAGTALNALAHCAEALYAQGRSDAGDEQALAGAPLIASALPRVLAAPHDRDARRELLEGAMHGGHALGLA
ncbi:MAG: iron-containing alcohol dehydrogenase, partial [Solirubrobacteraceae bacterium]